MDKLKVLKFQYINILCKFEQNAHFYFMIIKII